MIFDFEQHNSSTSSDGESLVGPHVLVDVVSQNARSPITLADVVPESDAPAMVHFLPRSGIADLEVTYRSKVAISKWIASFYYRLMDRCSGDDGDGTSPVALKDVHESLNIVSGGIAVESLRDQVVDKIWEHTDNVIELMESDDDISLDGVSVTDDNISDFQGKNEMSDRLLGIAAKAFVLQYRKVVEEDRMQEENANKWREHMPNISVASVDNIVSLERGYGDMVITKDRLQRAKSPDAAERFIGGLSLETNAGYLDDTMPQFRRFLPPHGITLVMNPPDQQFVAEDAPPSVFYTFITDPANVKQMFVKYFGARMHDEPYAATEDLPSSSAMGDITWIKPDVARKMFNRLQSGRPVAFAGDLAVAADPNAGYYRRNQGRSKAIKLRMFQALKHMICPDEMEDADTVTMYYDIVAIDGQPLEPSAMNRFSKQTITSLRGRTICVIKQQVECNGVTVDVEWQVAHATVNTVLTAVDELPDIGEEFESELANLNLNGYPTRGMRLGAANDDVDSHDATKPSLL